MVKFNLQEIYYYSAQHRSGIYLLKFPNGMNYIGSSKDIKNRLAQHMRNFFTPYKVHNEWYIDAKTSIVDDSRLKSVTFERACFTSVLFYVQYTDSEKYARELERRALIEIKENNWTDKYYNTQF